MKYLFFIKNSYIAYTYISLLKFTKNSKSVFKLHNRFISNSIRVKRSVHSLWIWSGIRLFSLSYPIVLLWQVFTWCRALNDLSNVVLVTGITNTICKTWPTRLSRLLYIVDKALKWSMISNMVGCVDLSLDMVSCWKLTPKVRSCASRRSQLKSSR